MLLGFQVTRGKKLSREVTTSQIGNFLKRLGLNSAESIIFYLVPKPELADKFIVKCDFPLPFKDTRIIKMPKNYG